MKISTVVLFSTFALSSAAFALDGIPGSGFLHNAAGGKLEASAELAYSSLDLKDSSDNPITEYKGTGMVEAAKVEYGITNMTSVGLYLDNYSYKVTSTPTSLFGAQVSGFTDSGLADPQLFVNNRMDLGPGVFRFGGTLGVSPGTHTMSNNFGENAYSGGDWLAPYVGYEMYEGSHTFGARLSYMLFLGNRKFHHDTSAFWQGYDSTGQGGATTSLDAFYEYSFTGSFLLGFDLNYKDVQTTKETVSGVQKDDENGVAGIGGELYAAYVTHLTADYLLVFIPFIQQGVNSAGMDTAVKTSTIFTAGLGATFIF